MKREVKLLLEKACDSLILAIEFFNRPYDRGRISATLIMMDHSFEMLLKASILHRGGRIRERRARQTIGFDACVRRSLSDGRIKFLSEEQALALQTINSLRDAAQHHLLDISEGQLYIHIQSGVTLFRDILRNVFGKELITYLPRRVLPVSTSPPTDLEALFDFEVAEIKKLLEPGRRRWTKAKARLLPLAILDATIQGKKGQPSTAELRHLGEELLKGRDWAAVFPGVAAIEIVAEGTGPSLALRLTKKEGIPIQLVQEGTPGASVVAVKRVNELDFYNLGAKRLAEMLGLTVPKLVAVVDCLGIREMEDCYKEFKIDKVLHKRYSAKAIDVIKDCLKKKNIEDIWQEWKEKKRKDR